MKKNATKAQVSAAIQACLEKKAEELTILEMEKGSGAFTDYFVLCSGTNPRQVQAIADEVELRLKAEGLRPGFPDPILRWNRCVRLLTAHPSLMEAMRAPREDQVRLGD